MDEVKFVLKGLGVAILLTVLLQLKVGGETLETKSDRLLHHSVVGIFMNQSAEGAGRLLRKGHQMVMGFIGSTKHERAHSGRAENDSVESESLD